VVENSRIVAIDPEAGPLDYDLRGLTVLPGWIDAHVHIDKSFRKDRKNGSDPGTPEDAAYQVASNAWVTPQRGGNTGTDVRCRRWRSVDTKPSRTPAGPMFGKEGICSLAYGAPKLISAELL